MIGAIETGFLGMERATGVVDRAASGIAKTSSQTGESPDGDVAKNMANLIVGHTTYDANAKVIEVAARMLDKIV
jgi:flagellar hook protein FlgE